MSSDPSELRYIEQTVLLLARLMLDDPDAVRIELVTENLNTTIRLHVASSDGGKLISKQGRTARSLRVIANAISMKFDRGYRSTFQMQTTPREPS